MSEPIPRSLDINSRPRCPECDSIAIASRLIFSPVVEEGADGNDAVVDGYFTYMGKVCKSCEHQWRPEEGS